MNHVQARAKLVSAREQAEMNMPMVIPYLNEMIKDVDHFGSLLQQSEQQATEPKQFALFSAVESWVDFVNHYGDNPDFEKNMQEFRNRIDTGDGDRTPIDAAFISYSFLYAVDFASVICSVEGGLHHIYKLIDGNELDQEKIIKLLESISSMLRQKAQAAQCFMKSIGINGPHEAIIQQDWLQEIVKKKTNDADMKFTIAEIGQNGEIHLRPEEEENICWKRKDDEGKAEQN